MNSSSPPVVTATGILVSRGVSVALGWAVGVGRSGNRSLICWDAITLDSSSTFIRSVFNGMGYGYFNGGYSLMRSQNLLCSMVDTVKAFNEGRITSYAEVIRMSMK